MKLRPVVPAELPDHLRESANFGVEVDAVPGGFVCSGTMKGSSLRRTSMTRCAASGRSGSCSRRNSERFSPRTRRSPRISTELSVLGPIFVLKLKSDAKGFSRTFVAELWLYPDGSRIRELSTKCDSSELFDVASEGRAFLDAKGIDLSGDQEMKTRKALQFFSKELRAAQS